MSNPILAFKNKNNYAEILLNCLSTSFNDIIYQHHLTTSFTNINLQHQLTTSFNNII